MTGGNSLPRTFTPAEKLAAAERECAMRRRVYGRDSVDGQLPPGKARELALMEAIAADYREQVEGGRLL